MADTTLVPAKTEQQEEENNEVRIGRGLMGIRVAQWVMINGKR